MPDEREGDRADVDPGGEPVDPGLMSPGWKPHMNRISGRPITTTSRLMPMLTTSAELVERRLDRA